MTRYPAKRDGWLVALLLLQVLVLLVASGVVLARPPSGWGKGGLAGVCLATAGLVVWVYRAFTCSS